MSNKLVTVEDQLVFMKLKIDHKDYEVVDILIRAAEDLLMQQTARSFDDADTVTGEIHDGEGTWIVYADKPIEAIIELVIIRPDDDTTIEYDYNIDNDITWRVGERRIVSHTLPFPKRKDNIRLAYTSQADKPEIAKQAVRELVANIYRRRGSEDARSEHIGSFEHVLIRDISKETIIWQFAVDLLHIPTLG